MRGIGLTIVCLLAAVTATFAADSARADEAAPAAAPEAETAFDPGRMPEAVVPASPLGLRYSALSSRETRALRRSFKLPLDALVGARSASDLASAAVVAPLPDPSRPLLAVSSSAAKADPFAGGGASVSFRDNPLKALGEMLTAMGGGASPADATATTDAVTSPFDDAETDPFAGSSTPADEPDAEVATESEDPFGGSDDSFGDDEDPFAF